jgi:hypothetical protein
MAAREGRRIKVGSNDVLLVGGYELTIDILHAVINPDARILWAFIRNRRNPRLIQPVAYDETRVVWIEDSDLEHIDIGV